MEERGKNSEWAQFQYFAYGRDSWGAKIKAGITQNEMKSGEGYSKWHDYTIGTLDVLQACDACADMGMTYSVIVQCTDCVVFASK